MKLLIYLTIVAVVLFTVCAKPATNDDDYDPSIVADDPTSNVDDDYDPDDDPEEDDDGKELDFKAPDILTESQTIYVKPGDDVYLNCDATNADYYTTMWTHGEDIIFQDTHLLLSKPAEKFQRFENRTMLINDFQRGDEGDYVCQILSQMKAPKVIHHVKINTVPSITLLQTTSGRNDFNVGDGFTLKCEATGSPPPKITWSLKGKRFEIDGHELTISEATHADAGLYQCLADNHIGMPAHATINIQIYQMPAVQIERFTTLDENGSFNVEIICMVHAFPDDVTVDWTLNDSHLTSNPHRKMRNKNHKYTLDIKDAKEDDFGRYTCTATNEIGSTNKSVHVSNKPGKPKFIHGDHKHGNNGVTLGWKLESMFTVSKVELKFRNIQDENWSTILPELTDSEGNMYHLQHTLEHLTDSKYEAMSRAKNIYGWGEYSDITPFNGRMRQHHHQHPIHPIIEHTDQDKETVLNSDEALKSTSRDSGSTLVPSIVLLLATILTILSLRH